MSFKDKWKNKVDGVDDVIAEDINLIAEEIISMREDAEADSENLNTHRTSKILDHPDGSVTSEKLADGAISSEKLGIDVKELLEGHSKHLSDIQSDIDKSAIVCKAQSDNIAVSDSSNSNLRGLHIYGKTTQQTTNGYQLFDASKIATKTIGSVTITNNGDGSFTVSGSGNTTSAVNVFYNYTHEETLKLLKEGRLTLSVDKSVGPYVFAMLRENVNDTALATLNIVPSSSKLTSTATITSDILNTEGLYIRIGFYAASGSEIVPGTIKPMLYQDGDGTWEPFTGGVPAPNVNYPQPLERIGDDGSVDVNVHGYQLFDVDRLVPTTNDDIPGVTITNNGDGSLSFSGKPTESKGISYKLEHDELVKLIKAGKITVTGDVTSANPYVYVIISKGDSATRVQVSTSSTVGNRTKEIPQEKLDDERYYATMGVFFDGGKDINNTYAKPMIYQDGDGNWEPFKPIQTFTASTPNGLSGIPVSSDGNYTDASGQQWVCDEIDHARDVYVQRIGITDVNITAHATLSQGYAAGVMNTNTINKIKSANVGALCERACILVNNDAAGRRPSTFYENSSNFTFIGEVDDTLETLQEKYNGAKLMYVLDEPIETPLSDEEIAAYKALQTYKPNTSIHNSDNAYMSVDYVADTKNYIDNKIKSEVAELKALILEV